MDDLHVLTNILEGCTIKLSTFDGDNHPRKVELIDDGLLDKVAGIVLDDLGQRFCLYRFGKVVDGNDKELSLPGGWREWFKDVHSLLRK